MLRWVLVCLLLVVSVQNKAWADVQYIHLEPPFVVNYGSTGRMRYMKTEIALKVTSVDAAGKVSAHKPYIRNNIVMLFSGQEPTEVSSPAGQERLRKAALENIRQLMTELEEDPCVDDLYFSNFVIQS